MNDQIERATIPQTDSGEMTHIPCDQTTDAESLVDLNEHKSRNVPGPGTVDGIAKQLVIGGILDQIVEQSTRVADQRGCTTDLHQTAHARRRALPACARCRHFAASDAGGTARAR